MSNRYKGGVISATPPTTSGGESGTASGAWTLEQQMQAQAAGLWPVAPPDPSLFIENLFNTWLYTGNDLTQVITNGIDLATKGGLVWNKGRDSGTTDHKLVDTARGTSSGLITNTTDVAGSSDGFTSFNTTGFTFGGGAASRNNGGTLYCSWTFRKQPKFFDVVTYTGNGSAGGQTINHSLGSAPGCIIVKQTNVAVDWRVYHQTQGISKYASLNTTAAFATDANNPWKTPTSTTFGVGDGTYWTSLNESGGTYVAYLFAHDAGGFGLTGTDNVISCGTFSGSVEVNLGYEAQWILFKDPSGSGSWYIQDIMRGMAQTQGLGLSPNTAAAESNFGPFIIPTATGFKNVGGGTYIYIAIRRGPMKVPTSGTSVFSVESYNQTSASDPAFNLSKVADAGLRRIRDFEDGWNFQSRLTGNGSLITNSTAAESTSPIGFWDNNVGWYQGNSITPPYSQANWYGWTFARAPSFFDVVCYTGNGSSPGQTLNHNLNAVPELIIWKARSNGVNNWYVYNATVGTEFYVELNTTIAKLAFSLTGSRTPTSTVFHTCTGGDSSNNGNNITYVAYLFATCAGVSKVGSYTGTATTKQIDCGFTGGARFVLIKRTDSTGAWYVWDTARGIVSGNDPYLLLNSDAAEVTNTDYVDTYSAGFEISSTAPSAINASGGSFIFLAIA